MRHKKILLAFHHLRLPQESGGLRSYHILNRLKEYNAEILSITVLLPSIDPLTGQPSLLARSKGSLYDSHKISFRFIDCPPFDKKSPLSRYVSYLIYGLKAFFIVPFLGRYHGYLVTTYSLAVLMTVFFASKIYGAFFWVEVRDLFPQGLLASLNAENSICLRKFISIYRQLEKFALRSADLVLPNSEGFVPTLFSDYKLSFDKVKFYPLGIDSPSCSFTGAPATCSDDVILAIDRIAASISTYDLSLVYCGSLDTVHSPSLLKSFCNQIQYNNLNVSIHLFGGSSANRVLSESFDFVHDFGVVTKERLSRLLPIFDASLYLSSPVYPFNSILGNKVFDYIHAELPILFLSSSYALAFALDNSLGFYIDPMAVTSKLVDDVLDFRKKSRSSFHLAKSKYNSIEITSRLASQLLAQLFSR